MWFGTHCKQNVRERRGKTEIVYNPRYGEPSAAGIGERLIYGGPGWLCLGPPLRGQYHRLSARGSYLLPAAGEGAEPAMWMWSGGRLDWRRGDMGGVGGFRGGGGGGGAG